MKQSVCSQLMFLILFAINQEYSVEEAIQQQPHHYNYDHHPQQPQYHHNHQHNHHQLKQQQHNHPNPINQQQHQNHPYPTDQQQQQLQNQQHHFEIQHHTLAESMQQVLLDTDRHGVHVDYKKIEWKHESNQHGEMSQFYMQHFESSYNQLTYHQLINIDQAQQQQYLQYHHLHYYQQQQHHHQHQQEQEIYHYRVEEQLNNDYALEKQQPIDESCNSYDSTNIMLQNDLEEPTCKATSSEPKASDSNGNVPNFSELANKPHNSNIAAFLLTPDNYHYESSLMVAIRHYWREVLGLCLASAIFLNWLFVIVKRRFLDNGSTQSENTTSDNIHQQHAPATRSISKDTNSSAHDSAFEEQTSPTIHEDTDISSKSSIDQQDKSSTSVHVLNTSATIRQRTSTLKAEPIPIPSAPGHNNSQTTSLSNSLNNSEYLSRYSSDFDSIQRLGRGGFGIVFEARNKIDDCRYAVKRICLPLEKEARERVMREVRALAKLDHAGIVRYYNAWLETPSDEWLKQHDAQLGIGHSKDGLSFPSTDGIYERNESDHVTKGSSEFGESGDNSLYGNSPFKRRKNGYRRLLKNNSSSPSLDIVFEGSGSIRLEAENSTEKTDSSDEKVEEYSSSMIEDSKSGDNDSDSDGNDFILFAPSGNKKRSREKKSLSQVSISGHLTEPFSSSESESVGGNSRVNQQNNNKEFERKNALIYQKEMRQFNNASLHGEKVYLYIQMQLCRKDTLKDWLKTNCDQRDKTTLFDLFYQIVDAVEYVHSQDLIHRDLKPSNIFFSLDGTLKIGDFGLCRTKTSGPIGSSLDLQECVAESDVERGFEAVHTEQVGTQLYMSPEQLNGLCYNQKVDIFAMGLILLELLIPFKTQMQRVNVLFKARNNLYSEEFRLEHPLEHELVRALLSRNPLKRPSATEIKQHELLASAQLSQPVIERIYHRRRTISSNSSTE